MLTYAFRHRIAVGMINNGAKMSQTQDSIVLAFDDLVCRHIGKSNHVKVLMNFVYI